jgi:hypothetical protein
MSLIKDGITVIQPGSTLMGKHEGRLVNSDMEGREGYLSHEDFIDPSVPQLTTNAIGRRTKVRVMRNTTGGKIYGGTFVRPNLADGLAKIGQAAALGDAGDTHCAIVDPLLPASGVEDDDLFLAYVEGPAKVLMPEDGIDTTAGDFLVVGADGLAAVGDGYQLDGLIAGTFLKTALAAANDAVLVEVLLHPEWE